MHCLALYPTRKGLSCHLNQSGSCQQESLKVQNQLFGKHTCHCHPTTYKDKSNLGVGLGPSHMHRSLDTQPSFDSSNQGVRLKGKTTPANKQIPADNAIIDISDDHEGQLGVKGVGVAEEAMYIDQGDSLGRQNNLENMKMEPPWPKYLPSKLATPPEPFDSATHVENHPDHTAGGVLKWVVNVKAPLLYVIILEDHDIFEIAHWLANQPLTDKGCNTFLCMARVSKVSPKLQQPTKHPIESRFTMGKCTPVQQQHC
jgi:hypothetical protein